MQRSFRQVCKSFLVGKKIKTFLPIAILFGTFQLSQAQTIETLKRIENDSVYIDFINPYLAPIEIKLSPLDSTKTFIKGNSYGVLKHIDTLKNALILPVNRVKDTSKINLKRFIEFKANFGDPNSKIDRTYEYSLPFPRGKRYKIIQSFGGNFSHNKPHSKYAIDIGTQIGDTITAIRPGTVFFVKEDSKEHCRTPKCVDKGNKVLILHDDGSIANYVHLDFNGAFVAVGDRVKDSEPIAISGMTGFTTIPHLHLVIHQSRGVSIPFKFKGQNTKKLKKGRFYKRKH
jgi:murein DD-endopeptidase MepM/ murein hydrolase activator NlpD